MLCTNLYNYYYIHLNLKLALNLNSTFLFGYIVFCVGLDPKR